ncbi:hypothetical protein [Amycolatopsis minnesotensis]|uniref:PE family protein n=1 Tax=Amycolatopsis minnesotensis TaxID=337894 RepID=A0ABN2SL25_9PSEU
MPDHGYEVAPQELTAQAKTLAELGEQTNALAASANRLAERVPMLGTAPPAIHLAMSLREAAGRSGHTGEVHAAGAELNDFHRALRTSADRYSERDADVASALRHIEAT